MKTVYLSLDTTGWYFYNFIHFCKANQSESYHLYIILHSGMAAINKECLKSLKDNANKTMIK